MRVTCLLLTGQENIGNNRHLNNGLRNGNSWNAMLNREARFLKAAVLMIYVPVYAFYTSYPCYAPPKHAGE